MDSMRAGVLQESHPWAAHAPTPTRPAFGRGGVDSLAGSLPDCR